MNLNLKLTLLAIAFLNLGITFGQEDNGFLNYGCHKENMMYSAWDAVQDSSYDDVFTAIDNGSEKKEYYRTQIEEWKETDGDMITIGSYTFKIIKDIDEIDNPLAVKFIKKRFELDNYTMNGGTVVRVSFYSNYEDYDKIAYVCFFLDEEYSSCNFFGVAGPLFVEY